VSTEWGTTRKFGQPFRGGLYRTINRGKSWRRLDNIDCGGGEARIQSSLVVTTAEGGVKSPTAGLFVTTEGAGLWYSDYSATGSMSWRQLKEYPFMLPTRVQQNPFNMSELWVSSFGNGLYLGVLKSDDDHGSVQQRRKRSAIWWVTKGKGPAKGPHNMQFVMTNRKAVTGVAPCCTCWSINATGHLHTDPLCDATYFAAMRSLSTGTSGEFQVLPHGAPSERAILSDDPNLYTAAVEKLANHAVSQNWTGCHTDLEIANSDLPHEPQISGYLRFVKALSLAFQAKGLHVYIDGGGGAPMIWWENTSKAVYATKHLASFAQLPGQPHLMSMSTYWRERQTQQQPGLIVDRLINITGLVSLMAKAIRPLSRASIGLGLEFGNSSTLPPRQQFGWNVSSLRAMLDTVAWAGLTQVSIYTNPEGNQGVPTHYGTHGSWSSNVAPWFVVEVARFVNGPG
jgi:hypothetical protein